MEGKAVMEQTDGQHSNSIEGEAESAAAATNDLEGSSEEERNKIRLMRALVEKKDPSSKEFDDLMLRRFLRARDLDVQKASAMFLKYLEWKRTFVPRGCFGESEVSNDLAQNKVFSQGLDKNGRPIAVVFAGRHIPHKGGVDECSRFTVFVLEKLCARMPQGQEKFVTIIDLQGWGYRNSDIRVYIAALSILQDNFPERLGKLFIVHVPYMFMKAWKIIYPFIDNNTRKKIVFVENKHLKSTLLEDIDESQLPDVYGGKIPLMPIQNC